MHFFSKSTKDSSPTAQSKLDESSLGLTKSTSASTTGSVPPPYGDAIGSFSPVTQFQIEAHGVTSTQSLSRGNGDPTAIFRVQGGGQPSGQPEYVSIRPNRKSNSCALVHGADPNGRPISATVYRAGWGSSKSPRIKLFAPGAAGSIEQAIESDSTPADVVEVKSRSMMSRSQLIDTSFGKFQWRYGGRSERKETFNATNLLILERMDGSSPVRVAQLVRNDEFRTGGTTKWMAGNGGRLMMDLKAEKADQLEAFVISSCLCMLKKEVDRMTENTTGAIVGASA